MFYCIFMFVNAVDVHFSNQGVPIYPDLARPSFAP